MNKLSRRSLISALLLCAAVSPITTAYAKNYLVKNTAGFKKAVKKLKPGDNLVLANGIWHDSSLKFEAYGTAEKPITLMAQNAGDVILTGQSNLRVGGDHLIVSGLTFKDGYSAGKTVIELRSDSKTFAHNTRIVQNVIENYNKPTSQDKDFWLVVFGKNNRIDHNYFAGKTNLGPTLVIRLDDEAHLNNHHVIDHNYFGHRPRLGTNGGETIRIGTSKAAHEVSATRIIRNYFERCDGESEIISIKSHGNLITENVFVESQGALVFRHGGDNIASRNIFFGNGVKNTGGIRVINDNQTVVDNYLEGLRGDKNRSALAVMNGIPKSPAHKYHQVKNATIKNNSFYDMSSIDFGTRASETNSLPPINSRFSQNILYTDIDNPLRIHSTISGISFSQNISNHDAFSKIGVTIDKSLTLKRAANGLLYPEDDAIHGAPRDLKPLSKDKAGPIWYQKP